MAFTRFTKNVLNVSALPDKVQNKAQALKATFDQAGVDIKDALNKLIAELEASTSASNIGADVSSVATKTVQAILTAFETEIANRYTKAETDVLINGGINDLVKDVDINLTTGVITVTKKDGTVETFDTALEKVPAKFEIIESGTSVFLKITNVDGTSTQTDITELMNVYEFTNSDDVAFTVTGTGNEKEVSASIRNNSIGIEKLSLSVISQFEGYVTSASNSANEAKGYATEAKTAKEQASSLASTATTQANSARSSADSASNSAGTATTKANEAAASANLSSSKATEAESYTHGGTGTREGEDTDNAKYYSEIAKEIAGGDVVTQTEMEAYAQQKGTTPTYETKTLSGDVIETDVPLGMESVLKVSGNSEQDTSDVMPSPDYPSEIRSVKSKSDNLLPQNKYINSKTTNGITYTKNSDGTFNINGTATANTSITIIQDIIQLEANQPYYLYSSVPYDSNTFNLSIIYDDNGAKFFKVNSTSTLTTKITNARLELYVASGNSVNAQNVKLQLNKGNKALPYQPYGYVPVEAKVEGENIEPKTLSLPLGDIELRSTPDGTRDTFVRVDGVWNKKNNVSETVLNGSEAGWFIVEKDNVNVFGYKITGAYGEATKKCIISNYFVSSSDSAGNIANTIRLNKNGQIFITIENTNSIAESIDTFKTWLSNNPIEVIYLLATPTYTPITEQALIQALDELESLILHKGYNRITVTSINGVKAQLELAIPSTASVTEVVETESSLDMPVLVAIGDGDVKPKVPKENQMTLNPSTGIAKIKGEKVATIQSFSVTIPTSGWIGTGPYYIDIELPGLKATDKPHYGLLYSNVGVTASDKTVRENEQLSFNEITAMIANDNSLRVICDNRVPLTQIALQLEVIR